jgi:hypothetical protein
MIPSCFSSRRQWSKILIRPVSVPFGHCPAVLGLLCIVSILILLPPTFQRALVVRIPAYLPTSLCPDALAMILVPAGAGAGRFLQEEV